MCITTTTRCLVFLCSFCVVCIQIGYGLASITCTTAGELNSTCLPSGACYEEHSIPEQQEECESKLLHINKTVSFSGYNITECDRDHTGFNRCNALKAIDHAYLVSSLSFTIVPLDAQHFSMDVSWSWFDDDFKSTHGKLVGYELRISSVAARSDATMKCLCIWEPFLRNISLGFDPALHYRASSFNKEENMMVTLFTLPYNEIWQYKLYSVNELMSWPITCQNYDRTDTDIFCPVQLPNAPTRVSVLSRLSANATKELDVSWISRSVAPPPSETYYATVFDNLNNITMRFVVIGSRNIKISGLHANTNYSFHVQVYSICSGISLFYSNYSRDIGCGALSNITKESFLLSTTASPVFPISTGYTHFHNHRVLFIASTSIMASLILAFALVGLLFLSIFLYHKRYRMGIREDPNPSPLQLVDPQSKLDALVLYSQGSPTSEQIEIEQYIVCLLKRDRLKVLSCNDHTEKTIMQWVEENARSAHAVFVVCNKEFYNEWGMQFRTPLINSLEVIIASAVSQKTIKKYATVLLKPSDEQYIPDNLYLKGIRSFVVGARATTRNRAEFISFIKMQHLLNK